MDKITQKHYRQAIGIPVPNFYVMEYKKEWQEKYQAGTSTIGDQEAIEEILLLSNKTDFVIKASHQLKGSAILVSYDDNTKEEAQNDTTKKHRHILMGTKSGSLTEDYNTNQVAIQMAQSMHKRERK